MAKPIKGAVEGLAGVSAEGLGKGDRGGSGRQSRFRFNSC